MRALLLVLDSAGCGDALAPASVAPGGANTLDHLFRTQPDLRLPVLHSLGLYKAVMGDVFHPLSQGTRACWGRMREQSPARATTTGHWEMAGAQLREPFPLFTEFPADFIAALQRDARVEFLGNRLAEGQVIIEELGAEHLRTGRPILYTSTDSVLQIAAHEQVLPAARLHELCRLARRHADKLRVGRVIARPFAGVPGHFTRTADRREYAMLPPRTVLNAVAETGLQASGLGKVGDLFAGSGITRTYEATHNREALAKLEELWSADEDGLIFANLSDFEALYTRRRDAQVYGRTLQELDQWIAHLLQNMEGDDLVIITADHGLPPKPQAPLADDNFHVATQSRLSPPRSAPDEVPLLMLYQDRVGPLGTRRTYSDVAATLGEYFHLRQPWPTGRSFLHSRATRVRKG